MFFIPRSLCHRSMRGTREHCHGIPSYTTARRLACSFCQFAIKCKSRERNVKCVRWSLDFCSGDLLTNSLPAAAPLLLFVASGQRRTATSYRGDRLVDDDADLVVGWCVSSACTREQQLDLFDDLLQLFSVPCHLALISWLLFIYHILPSSWTTCCVLQLMGMCLN